MKKNKALALVLIYILFPLFIVLIQFPTLTSDSWFAFGYYSIFHLVPLTCLIGAKFTLSDKRSLIIHWCFCQIAIMIICIVRWLALVASTDNANNMLTRLIMMAVYHTVVNTAISLGSYYLKKSKEISHNANKFCGTLCAALSMSFFVFLPLALFILNEINLYNMEFASMIAIFISPIWMIAVAAFYGRFAKKNGIGWRGFGIWSASLIVFAFAFYFFCFGNYSSPEYWSSHLLLTTIVFAVLFIFSLVPYLIPVKSKLKE